MQLFPALLWALLWQLTSALVPKKDVKPNVFVLTDISNEPDDAESLVRLLLYSNEVSIKGIVATTSYWLNYTVHDEDIYPILDAYEKVWPNLLKHSKDYPTADSLRELVSTGYKAYGLDAFQAGEPSSGAKKLISAMSEIPQNEKLDILVWGGAGVLAEALKYSSVELIDSVSEKLRVYSISDQDDGRGSGPIFQKSNISHLCMVLTNIVFQHGWGFLANSTTFLIKVDQTATWYPKSGLNPIS